MRAEQEWNREIGRWLSWLKAGVARPKTLELRKYQLRRLAADLAPIRPWEVTVHDLSEWIAGHTWGVSSTQSYRSALRSFYGWAHATGVTSKDPARLLRPVKSGLPNPRPVAEGVIKPAIAAAEERERLMLVLGSRCGMRRSEIAQVHTDDLIRDLVGWTLVVHGKGGKDRPVPLENDIAALLWAAGPGYVFPGRRGVGHLGEAWVAKLMKRAMDGQASSHQLRHRFATNAYRETKDLLNLSLLMGHASPVTTRLYVLPDLDDMRRVMASVT